MGYAKEDNWAIVLLLILTLFFGFVYFYKYKSAAIDVKPLHQPTIQINKEALNNALTHAITQGDMKAIHAYKQIAKKNGINIPQAIQNKKIVRQPRTQSRLSFKQDLVRNIRNLGIKAKALQEEKNPRNTLEVKLATLGLLLTYQNVDSDLQGGNSILIAALKEQKISPQFLLVVNNKLNSTIPDSMLDKLNFSSFLTIKKSSKNILKMFTTETLEPLWSNLGTLLTHVTPQEAVDMMPIISTPKKLKEVLKLSQTTKSETPYVIKVMQTSLMKKFSLLLLFIVSSLSLLLTLYLKFFVWRNIKPQWVRVADAPQ